MRQLGKLESQSASQQFADYLLTQQIKTQVEAEADGWAIWVLQEDDVPRARAEYAEYLKTPQDPKYPTAARAAAQLRQAATQKDKQASRNIVDVRRRWERPTAGRCPITFALLAICLFVAFNTKLDLNTPLARQLMISPPGTRWPDFPAIKQGELWRLLTPIFLHFSQSHIIFNALSLLGLGSTIEFLRGSLRFGLMVVAIGIISNVAQYAAVGPNFGGMSGVVYGLFGYMLMKSRYEPQSGFYVSPNTTFLMLGWLGLCFFSSDVANTAHMMGLGVGILLGGFRMVWRRFLGHAA